MSSGPFSYKHTHTHTHTLTKEAQQSTLQTNDIIIIISIPTKEKTSFISSLFHFSVVFLSGKELVGVGRVNGGLSRGPVGGADFAVSVCELDGLHETEGLIDGTANGKIVDCLLADFALCVNNEQSTAQKVE